MNETHRGTGRTTRMLEEAIKQAVAGRAVSVIMAKKIYAKELQQFFDEHYPTLDIKFETPYTPRPMRPTTKKQILEILTGIP